MSKTYVPIGFIFILVPFVLLGSIMIFLCLSFKADEDLKLTPAAVTRKLDDSQSEPVKHEPTEATSTVNLKYHLNSGSIEPGVDLNKNLRMNLMTGDIEFGTTIGNGMWMKF